MSISRKNPPRLNNSEMSRAFEEVYDVLNEIINSVNSNLVSVQDTKSGKTGDIRITKVSEDKYRLEAKSKEGWVRPGGVDNTITELIDSTTGTASNTLNDTSSSVKDDLASLASKVNEIITELNNITFRLVKKNE